MKIGRTRVKWFQSFKEFEFDYSDLGLSVIGGLTGAGKSTVFDAPYWVTFGETSKDSNADDVLAWGAEEPTEGTTEILTATGKITVTRTRGKGGNDLYFTRAANPDKLIRGKDIPDTQKKIIAELGVNSELFNIGSYLSQFSKADSFFVAPAKDRRKTMESIADQALAVKLGDRTSALRKAVKAELAQKELDQARENGRGIELANGHKSLLQMRDQWILTRAEKVKNLRQMAENFDTDKEARIAKILAQLEELDKITVAPGEFDAREAQVKQQLGTMAQIRKELAVQNGKLYEIKARLSSRQTDLAKQMKLGDTCPVCLGPTANENRDKHLEELEEVISQAKGQLADQTMAVDRLEASLKVEDKLRADYDKIRTERGNNDRLLDRFEALQKEAITLRAAANAYQEQAAALEAEQNPFERKLVTSLAEIEKVKKSLENLNKEVARLSHKVTGLNWLYDKSFELRGALMAKAVRRVNKETNRYLEQYFDAMIRVQFSLTDSDKLDVSINNSGYDCPFRQLSGGERRVLSLCFNLALMRAAQDKAGVDFQMVMLDEALHGLDDTLKAKAFGLLQELENTYPTVLLIDHSEEFKNLFTNRFLVTKTSHSEISKAG